MRNIILFLLTLFTLQTFSQKVTISGTALDTTNGRNRVYIVVNDTLRKFREGKSPDWAIYRNLIKDTSLSLFTKADGRFQLKVNITDSIFFQSFRHIPQQYSVSDLLKMKTVNLRLEPQICTPYVACKDTLPSRFYIFVGQKLKVTPEPEPFYCGIEVLGGEVKAEYKILEQVVGKFPKDTIVFSSFNHNRRITFSNYENVLLFVGEYCGELYHEKYQYFELYKTADGKWASPGDPYRYDSYQKKNLVAQNIKFAETVYFDISKLSEAAIKMQYPEPYYKIEGQRAIPVMGSYINDLITVKRDGYYKARNIKLD